MAISFVSFLCICLQKLQQCAFTFSIYLCVSVSLYQSVHPSVYVSECKNSVSTTWIFTKFKITQFY
jgi:hypothetical protein